MSFNPLWYAVGISTGILIGSNTDYVLKKYTFKQADLNGDGIKQELVAIKRGTEQIALFPDTNGVYVLDRDFDFSSLTNLETKVETIE